MKIKAHVPMEHRKRNQVNPFKHLIVRACMWPKSRYVGGITNRQKEWKEHYDKDIEEVRAILERKPTATRFDVALEGHFGDNHAARLLKKAKEGKGKSKL